MRRSLGLRVRVAFRVLVGIAISSVGSFLVSQASSGGFFDVLIAGVVWLLATFVALVIALEGAIVLIEETVSSMDGGT